MPPLGLNGTGIYEKPLKGFVQKTSLGDQVFLAIMRHWFTEE